MVSSFLKTAFADGAYKLTTMIAWYNLFAGEKLNRHSTISIQLKATVSEYSFGYSCSAGNRQYGGPVFMAAYSGYSLPF